MGRPATFIFIVNRGELPSPRDQIVGARLRCLAAVHELTPPRSSKVCDKIIASGGKLGRDVLEHGHRQRLSSVLSLAADLALSGLARLVLAPAVDLLPSWSTLKSPRRVADILS